jgi:hypothetical protein
VPPLTSILLIPNDVPVGSIKLTPDNIDDSWSTFQLPSRLFVGGNNTLTIEAGIQVDEYYDDPYWCLEDYWGSAWLVVYADSLFKIPGGIPAELALNLNHYPYAFIGPANLSDLAFVVPANADAGIGVPIVEIIRGMGRMLQGETLYPRVITDDMALTGKDVPTHQIMVGLPSENQAIVGLNDVLPQPFREGSNEPVLVEAIGQVVPAKGAAGYLETVLDPMNAKPRMVVTGTSDKGLLWAAQILGNPRLLANAQGDLAIVDGPRQVRIYDVNPKSERLMVQPIAEQVTEVVVEPTSPWNLRLYLSVAFFVLTFAVLFVVAFTKIR